MNDAMLFLMLLLLLSLITVVTRAAATQRPTGPLI